MHRPSVLPQRVDQEQDTALPRSLVALPEGRHRQHSQGRQAVQATGARAVGRRLCLLRLCAREKEVDRRTNGCDSGHRVLVAEETISKESIVW